MCALRDTQPGAGGEALPTDALSEVILHGRRVLAVPLAAGRRRGRCVGSLKTYYAAFRACAARLLDG
jgi:hypothetical protein